MDLSIIMVPWNVRDLVRENLKSIYNTSPSPRSRFGEAGQSSPYKGEEIFEFEVFAVDNDSRDGTAEMIRNEFPRVKLIANNYNAGFARANNQAIKLAKGRYILLLNPDMRVLPGTLETMVKWMDEHLEAGVAGCHLVGQDGKSVPHVRRFPKLLDQLAIVLKLPHIFSSLLDKYLMRDFNYSEESEVDSIRGSFFMIRKEVIDKIGALDERYFIWFEEVDYCRRVKGAGWKVMYTPATECVDYVGKSFAQVKRGVTQKYFRNSMLKYFKKWHPVWQYWALRIAWPIGMLFSYTGDIFKLKSQAKT
jgi:GT2 family glycosyltransferase